jgi:hypothetical protein
MLTALTCRFARSAATTRGCRAADRRAGIRFKLVISLSVPLVGLSPSSSFDISSRFYGRSPHVVVGSSRRTSGVRPPGRPPLRWRLLSELAHSDYRVRELMMRVNQPQNWSPTISASYATVAWSAPPAAASTAATATTT